MDEETFLRDEDNADASASHKGMKTGLITLGIICSLALLIYLPVAIWSPPWTDNGYYIPMSTEPQNSVPDTWIRFWNGSYTEMEHHGNSLDSERLRFELKTNQRWLSSDVKRWSIGDVSAIFFKEKKLYFNEGNKVFNTGLIDFNFLSDISEKVENPITLCYIKYIEWTTK